ncbi:MAG: DUF885 domain-containing protein [Pseudomonadota bacterium]
MTQFFRASFMPLALGLCLGLAACSRETPPAPAALISPPSLSESERFRSFLDENYAVDMARYPATASYRGIKTNHDQWNTVTEAFMNESREISEARLDQLTDFDRNALTPALQLSYDLYALSLQRGLAADDFRHQHFIIHQFRGPHTAAPSYLINIHRVDSLDDATAYIGRLHNIGSWFDQVIEQMAIRQDKGLLLAAWQYPQMIDAARNVIRGVPYTESGEDSTLWADIQAKLASLDLPPEQAEDLLAEARAALVEVVKPAYERLIAALETQLALASDDDGVWKFPDGDAFYAQRLRWYTTTELSADEIHRIGLAEVERIHNEMREIMAEVGFGGDLAAFFEYMRSAPEFYYPNTDEGRAEYLARASELINIMGEQLDDYFGLKPRAELTVKRVEPFRERAAGKAFYQGPPPDGSRPGIYYANLYNMAEMPIYQMEALAYHEGIPGHHMQRAISVELEDIPDFQKYASFTAYTEGWGLYSEKLPLEMGFYQDPYSNFGRLAMELWRACRLVVDTGLHSKRWPRQRAIDYLVANTPNPVGDSTRAIERYIAMPGQATAYTIGMLKILELRARAEGALGAGFDIRSFHDLVLENGPVPLSLLERKVDEMIAEALTADALGQAVLKPRRSPADR